MRKSYYILIGIAAALLLAVGVYYLPPVHASLAWRLDDLRTRIKYYFNPPEQALFLPTQRATSSALPTVTPPATRTPTLTATPLPPEVPTPTPTITLTPLPVSVKLPGVKYVDQKGRWNYCGPANLTMALNFWGWKGNRDDVAKAIKPGVQDPNLDFITQGKTDKNVMPYEMVNFVNDQTKFRALYRLGGEIDLLKRMIAAGFPVVAEKGYYEKDYAGKLGWLGHYQFVTGYDDTQGVLIVQDTWNDGPNYRIPYPLFEEGWRSFDFLFIVVYPPDRESQVMALLGDWSDSHWAAGHALDIANQDVHTLTGIDEFFAWFAKGTSHVALLQYVDAAYAYDYAFQLYANLGADDKQRPYRSMWYQTGPYWAYYYSGRYSDVISLADTTLNDTISEPSLEESLYWRALAEYALGDTNSAYADIRRAVYLNKNFQAALDIMGQWGIGP
jgi:tetratricopeptide (TPR) repeat protein